MSYFPRFFRINRQRLLKPLIFAAILLVEVCSGFSPAQAQSRPVPLDWPTWVRIGGIDIDVTLIVTAIYFSDTLHGVAAYTRPVTDPTIWGFGNGGLNGYPPLAGDSEIWYTLDARKWHLSSVPASLAEVRVIRPINGKLYAAIAGQDLIVSTDQGVTWAYSGLGLTDAYDVYADPSGKIRTLTNPMREFARVDQMHCVAAGLNNAALSSSDGGVTWNTLSVGDDTVTSSVYGDTCKHVFFYHSNQGTILRSFDYGATWQQSLVGCGDTERIEGSGAVVYISTPSGLFRTTNDGNTYWSDINSVDTGPHVYSVFGPMGNDIAAFGFVSPADGYLFIWLTKDGGDYALRDPIDLADTLGNIVDTLQILSACPGLRIPIPFETEVDSFTTNMVVTQDSLSEFTLEGPAELHFISGVPDTAWFDYTPHSMPETNTLSIDFQHTWDCSSWSESRTIIVVSPSLASVTMPPVISGNCSLVNATASVTYLTPCQPLILTSISSTISSLKCTSSFPDTVSGGSSIPFQFDPGGSSINGTDTIEIKGHYAGTTTSFDTILTVTLDGSATAPQLSSQNLLDFGKISECTGVKDSFAYYYNHGCVTDTITSVGMGGLAFTWLTNSLPIIVQPGDSVQIGYRFAIPDTSSFNRDTATFVFDTGMTYTGTANVNVVSNGDTENTSIAITGSTTVVDAMPSITSQIVECGSVNPCNGDTILSDTIFNPDCDTIVISNIATFDDSNYFSLIAPANDTLILAPGDSGIVTFEFAPRYKGEWTGSLNLNTRTPGNFESDDIDIILRGFGGAGGKLLSANVQNVDFGSFYECQQGKSRDTTITLFNTGCDTLTVNYAEYSNVAYSSSTLFPFYIAPGSSHIVKLRLKADTDEIYGMNGTVTFSSDADTGASPLQPIALTASVIPPAKFNLSPSPPDSAKDGQSVTFYLLLSGGSSTNNIPGLNFDITHNNDLLSYLSANGVSVKQGILINSMETDTIAWGGASGLPVSNVPDTIGSLTFRVYLTDSVSTPLRLSNISLSDTLGIAPDCIASFDSSGSGFTYIYQCGNDLLRNALLGLPITALNIVPNPATGFIKVEGSAGPFTIFDPLGRSYETPGSDNLFDISSLPSGVYFVSDGRSRAKFVKE